MSEALHFSRFSPSLTTKVAFRDLFAWFGDGDITIGMEFGVVDLGELFKGCRGMEREKLAVPPPTLSCSMLELPPSDATRRMPHIIPIHVSSSGFL